MGWLHRTRLWYAWSAVYLVLARCLEETLRVAPPVWTLARDFAGPRRFLKLDVLSVNSDDARPGAWDRATINLPFSTMSIATGPLIHVPQDADETRIEAARLEVEAAMNAVTARAYELVRRR